MVQERRVGQLLARGVLSYEVCRGEASARGLVDNIAFYLHMLRPYGAYGGHITAQHGVSGSMYSAARIFENREQAGQELARAIGPCKDERCIVLAIPRGGVVVGYYVAESLGLPLDVIVPRKIPAPHQPELAIGAVASWGDHELMIDENSVTLLGVNEDYIRMEAQHQLDEVSRRLIAYRGTTDPPDVKDKHVIVVDDGIATGYTTLAAVTATRRLGAKLITLAVPVGPSDSVEMLRPHVDKLICLRTPSPFMAVGYWYRDFEQVSDSEVIDLLRRERSIETR